MNNFNPDWKLSPVDQMQVDLSLALTKHVPGWPGATDEQLEAVAKYVIDGQDVTKIESGSFPGATEMALTGNWKGIVAKLQEIARTTLEASERGAGNDD